MTRTRKLLTHLATALAILALVAVASALSLGRHRAAPATAPAAVVPPVGAAPAPRVHVTPAPAKRVAAPSRIEVPAIGVDEKLTCRGLKADGSLDTPDFGKAAWYSPGPRPGEPGGAVVVAHVHGPDGPDVFWDLATLRPGDTIRVHRPGAVATFVVDRVEDVPKEQLPYDRIWPDTGRSLLRLITCGGQRTAAGYPDNTIVFAHLEGTASVTG